jgi:hypothetical protein
MSAAGTGVSAHPSEFTRADAFAGGGDLELKLQTPLVEDGERRNPDGAAAGEFRGGRKRRFQALIEFVAIAGPALRRPGEIHRDLGLARVQDRLDERSRVVDEFCKVEGGRARSRAARVLQRDGQHLVDH